MAQINGYSKEEWEKRDLEIRRDSMRRMYGDVDKYTVAVRGSDGQWTIKEMSLEEIPLADVGYQVRPPQGDWEFNPLMGHWKCEVDDDREYTLADFGITEDIGGILYDEYGNPLPDQWD